MEGRLPPCPGFIRPPTKPASERPGISMRQHNLVNNTRLDEETMRELDGWRAGRTPRPSRSEAIRLLLKERLCEGRGT